jgi:hypothetical protein
MERHRAGKRADAVFLNKNPHLCNKLPLVRTLFPDARFIWIHRRLPQVVASLKRLFEDICRRQQTWHCWPAERPGTAARCWDACHFEPPMGRDLARVFPGGKVRFLAEYWLETNRAVARFFHSLPEEQKLSVREEDLIERPNEELSRCLTFLGLTLPAFPVQEEVDRTRNANWASLLTLNERLDLLAWIEEAAREVDTVFPGESGVVSNLVREALGSGHTP